MPIYEYYCAMCDGRFRHLARRIDAPVPSCPCCGHVEVERMISTAHVIHGERHHERELRVASAHIDADDPQAIAQHLQASGRLEGVEGLYGSTAYRELIARRAEGAADADLTDLTDDLTAQMQASEVSTMAGAVMFSDRVENRMQAEGPPERHDHEEAGAGAKSQSRPRAARDLGWG